MFDRVAPRYDLANTVLSFGRDRRWRRRAAAAAELAPGETAVDVACGTGGLTRELARAEPRASVLGLDFSWEMVRRARADGGGMVGVAVADAMRLPLRDASVDVVTIAFGLRNLPEPGCGLLELRRVLRPGGRLVVCEFSRPVLPVLRQVYDRYLHRLLPLLARRVSSDPEAYQYLARSISAWPDRLELARWLRGAGFERVRWQDLSGGIVALHVGTVLGSSGWRTV
ncbi:MAG TPA: ubiquinone/menaquinone biosynthesis methyltransferase [Actinomycetes bacterium]|jgi:demethylmenaquinone methyltransferase/2-methoxy-6-polyprenyl-1,4-benzoquinol methylase|nr:ubiquinone/menaquinone biosynthesis methyltransferase [Actinomycetes bacterium]